MPMERTPDLPGRRSARWHPGATVVAVVAYPVRRSIARLLDAVFSALTRLLLALALVLNGIGTATAGVRMAAMELSGMPGMAHAMPVEAAPQTANDDGDCMHHAAVVTEEAPSPAPASPHAGDDCARLCLAMCMQHCHAVAAGSLRLPVAGTEPAPATPAPVGLSPPSAPPPVRPPIA